MRAGRGMLGAGAAVAIGVLLSGCSVDTLVWGADGAEVIQATEQLIAAAAAGDAAPLVCEGYEPELREPSDWEGLGAEEPERFVADYWPDQAPHEPYWSINLSLPQERVASGVQFPGDVFYRKSDDGLCLVGVAWSTIQ